MARNIILASRTLLCKNNLFC